MKRGLLILLLLIIIPSVSALSVTLNAPTDAVSNSSTSFLLNCSVTEETYSMTSIKLYTDTSGTWAETSSSSGNISSAQFPVSSLSDGTYTWNCLAENANFDTAFASANYTFTVSTSTFSGPIANQSWAEDSNNSDVFDLDTYFSGATIYTVSGNSSIRVEIASDNVVTFSPVPNWTGSEIVIFTSDIGATSNSVNLTVTAVNDAPSSILNFSNKTLDRDENYSLDMTSYFEDIDGDALNYTISNSHFTIAENGDTITIIPEVLWTGSEEVYITASDSAMSAQSNTFTISVGTVTTTTTSSNNAPTVDSFTPDSDPSIVEGDSVDFSVTASDSESESLTYTWYIDDVDQSHSESTFSYAFATAGTFTIKVEISDGTDITTQSWSVTVQTEEEIEVASILSDSEDAIVCGNGVAEEGETCTSCPMDVQCDSGYICNSGVCEEKKSSTKAILIFFFTIVFIVVIGGFIYYYTTLRKSGVSKVTKPGVSLGKRQAPPVNYTDFYKGKK